MMTSAAETPSPLWMSVGMPRPLSNTVTEPSAFSVTSTLRGVAGEHLVDGVVDDLVDHVVQAGAVVGVADIHARALADRVEALQDLDRFGAVFRLGSAPARAPSGAIPSFRFRISKFARVRGAYRWSFRAWK